MSSTPSLNKINYLNVAAYAVNVFVTYLVGNGGLPGSKSNNELSEKYQTLVTPVGWAFSIWGIIFLSQAVYVVVQLLAPFRAAPLVQQGVAMNYVYVCIAQSVWGFVFGYEFIEFSAVCMVTILYFLVRTVVMEAKAQDETSTRDFWLLKFPFSIHCGWIVAASFVNINVVVVKYKAGANVQYFTALASLVTILVISAYTLYKKEFVIPTVLSWATVSSILWNRLWVFRSANTTCFCVSKVWHLLRTWVSKRVNSNDIRSGNHHIYSQWGRYCQFDHYRFHSSQSFV